MHPDLSSKQATIHEVKQWKTLILTISIYIENKSLIIISQLS
jgi:hypothetical protein